jgi:mono/diheme cytochrome c family protein
MQHPSPRERRAASALLVLSMLWLPLLGASPAQAHEQREARLPQQAWPGRYLQECASCHIAYPPELLPPASWQRLMGGLERHFGSDASLDPQDVQLLSHWLLQASAQGRQARAAAAPEDRITRSAWFERKHRQIEAATWRLPSVRSAANCAACHGEAALGRFSERELRMPPGLSARQRAAWDD